jgi:hypothetical protein
VYTQGPAAPIEKLCIDETAVPPGPVAVNTAEKTPGTVGVPLIVKVVVPEVVEEDVLSPLGRLPRLTEIDVEFVATTVPV